MRYKIEDIVALIGARRYGNAEANIEWLLTDSRSLVFPETSLFFAIKTNIGDGHNYINELYKRGVRNFVVTKLPDKYNEKYPETNFLYVIDSRKALQRLSERHREQYNIPIIGITGSNGKTIVKEWLNQLLQPVMNVTRSPRSYNSQIGVPLSVWLLDESSQIGVFEAGISDPGEMDALRDIIQPTIGIMVNLGNAHQENFPDKESKCREKLKLFKNCDVVIYSSDDEIIDRSISIGKIAHQQLRWSVKDDSAPLFVSSIEKSQDTTTISYKYDGHEGQYTLPFIDDASIADSIHCLAACLYLKLSPEYIHNGLSHLESVAMRMEVTQGVRNCTIINDSYNSDVNSLDIALDFMNRRVGQSDTKCTLILSDIYQSGMNSEALYTHVADRVNTQNLDKFIGIGSEISHFSHLFKNDKKFFFTTTEDFITSGILNSLVSETILLKGARSFCFEKISDLLALKLHETTLNIDLGAIVKNLKHYRSFMKPETKMVCMVKASAYGSGALEVSRKLQEHGVDYLAVAVADEGVALRKSGITANIMVMNPEMTTFRTMFHYRLEPEVYSFRILEALISEAEREGVTLFPIHIKIDTGMHRLGFSPAKIDKLISRLKSQNSVLPRSVFSHFVGSDSSEFDDFTAKQFNLFNDISGKLQDAFPHKILRHICNTAGIERFPQYHLDMVRLGIGLYGVNPINNSIINNVASLSTTILQIHDVKAEDTVGYSRKGHLNKLSRIAAIPIGYADGLNRHLGCGSAYCLVDGKPAKYVGNICMDVAMIDVTDIPCNEGDKVEIFGDKLPVSVLSDKLQTIPYEILTSISERVRRVYFQD